MIYIDFMQFYKERLNSINSIKSRHGVPKWRRRTVGKTEDNAQEAGKGYAPASVP